MANAFQKMLEQFRLTEKILAVNADNATLNDTQTTKLDQLDNHFKEENWVWCFNHTLQLSAKALLKPFNIGLSGKVMDDDNDPAMVMDGGDEGDEEEQANDDDDDEDDNIDELEELNKDEQNQVLQETAVVHETITKVSNPISK